MGPVDYDTLAVYLAILLGLGVGPWLVWYLFGVTVDYLRRKWHGLD